MNLRTVAKYYVAVSAVLAASPAAWADAAPPPPERTTPPIVGFLDAAKPACWARSYDAAHLKAHPKQKVAAIAFTYTPEKTFPEEPRPQPMWDQYSEVPAFNALVVVTLKGGKKALLGSAYCRASDDPKRLDCGIDGDGGQFTLTLKPDGNLRLDNPASFTVGDGEEGEEGPDTVWATISARDDQSAFLLMPATGGLCDEDY